MRWAGHVAGTGKKKNTCRILMGTSEGKTPLGGLIRSWECNVKERILDKYDGTVD
jgi:hypothetical protein